MSYKSCLISLASVAALGDDFEEMENESGRAPANTVHVEFTLNPNTAIAQAIATSKVKVFVRAADPIDLSEI
jgi:hypothetical protein